MRHVLTGIGVALAALSAAANPRFDVIEPLPGRSTATPLGVSADGCDVVGQSGYGYVFGGEQALRWRNGVSSPLREPPAANPRIAYAQTPDGEVVVGFDGVEFGDEFFRLDAQSYELIPVPGGAGFPTEARAVSADGQTIGGCTHAAVIGQHCDWPFLWRSGSVATLLNGLSGEIEFGSVEALSADGSLAAGVAGGRAVLWRPNAASVQSLGTLPGHTYSEARDVTPDGVVAVGVSRAPYPIENPRAFRWTAATGMVELGPEARIAHAVSADGKRIVGEGPNGAFIWDAGRGVRPLADALRDDYGLDVGAFELDAATALSPDGKTLVGTGSDGISQRGWRARLREEPCPPQLPPLPVIDLVEWHAGYGLALDGPWALGIDSRGRLSVTGAYSRNIERIGTDPASLANPVVEHLLDFSGDPPPTPEEPQNITSVLAIGADDSIYVGAFARQQLLRIAPDGSVTVVVDGSLYPPLPASEFITTPYDAALGPDGSLYVSAWARLLRVAPDGSVTELIDAEEAQEAGTGEPAPASAPLQNVEVDPQGRVFLSSYDYLLVLDGESGTVLESYPYWELPFTGSDMAVDPEGALWIFDFVDGLARRNPDGAFETIFSAWDIPDGADGTFDQIRALDIDDAGNVYYAGYSLYDGGSAVVRRTPDGQLTRVLGPETFYGQGEEVGWLSVSDVLVSDGLLFVSDWNNRIFRVELPLPPTVCANGLDDDGDGAADFPADKGCLSPEDEGERSFDFPCDNGLDDDSDGATDFPADPRCLVPAWLSETTACDDRADNDGDGHVDWNGGSVEGYPATPDPECAGDPSRSEHPWYCGLGFEVALVVLPLTQAARRWRKRRAHSTGDGVGSPERK